MGECGMSLVSQSFTLSIALTPPSQEHDLVAYAEKGPESTLNRKVHQWLHFLFFQTGVLGNPTAPLQLHTGLCICPWAIIDRVATMPCNTRGGDLATVEQLAWWPIRGCPCHPTGDIMQGKARERESKETP